MSTTPFSLDDLAAAFMAGVGIGRRKQRLKPYFDFGVEIQPKHKPKEDCMLELSITTEEQVLVRIAPKTANGRPAKVDGAPVWAVGTGEATITPSEDGLSCLIVSGENPGNSEISVSADADLGEGVEPISDLIELAVTGVKAVSLGLTAEAPTPKP